MIIFYQWQARPVQAAEPNSHFITAQQAYTNGDYQTARQEFAAVLADTTASSNEKRQALHWLGRSELLLGNGAKAATTLATFNQQYPDDSLRRATQFNIGLAYEQTGQFTAAITAYRDSLRTDDLINDYLYERMGDVYLTAQNYTDALTAYQDGLKLAHNDEFKIRLHEKIATVELDRRNPNGAMEQYQAMLKLTASPTTRAKILKQLGDAYVADDNLTLAYTAYSQAVNLYPTAYYSYLALVELVNANVPVEDFQRGLVDYHAKSYTPAVIAFQHYLTSTNTITPSQRTADALWLLGLSQKGTGLYGEAKATFERLIKAYPNYAQWGQAFLEIGEMLAWQDQPEQAKTFYRQFATDRPKHPLAADALWQAAYLELNGDLLKEAALNLRDLAETYPTSDYADDALHWSAWSAFQLKEYEQAAQTWGDLAKRYPKSELSGFGGYWQAKALVTLGRVTETRQILRETARKPLDYYALRAQDALAGRQPHAIPLVLPTAAQLADEQAEAESWLRAWHGISETVNIALPSDRLQQDIKFKRGQTLLALGLRDKALSEFAKVEQTWWDEPLEMYQLALYFQKQQMGQLSIQAVARVSLLSPVGSIEDAPRFIQRLFYPIYFPDLLFGEAKSQKIDPALALAIMRQESLFESSAESFAGARGLMQVMPATGDYVAQRTNFNNFKRDQLWLPYVSIKFGVWYIRQQVDLFEENQFAALAAYNAGPGYVLEWVKTSDDLDIFVESIPFRESRIYIRNIYINLAAYRRLYGAF